MATTDAEKKKRCCSYAEFIKAATAAENAAGPATFTLLTEYGFPKTKDTYTKTCNYDI